MVIDLKESLEKLSKSYGIIGMKQSFEDEGVLLNDVVAFKRVTEVCGLQSYVKIGGCEAKSDLYNCIRMGINGIIAPMVETPFALSKSLFASQPPIFTYDCSRCYTKRW